ncbi:MAG: hypothetical protein JNJ73_15210 [Hyphomonadaceae bacterium]|nr:hypothetical protein [Hyphomonadaceae bacterium]
MRRNELVRSALRAAALCAGVLAAGCATPCPDAPPEAAQQRFRCEDGSRLDVTFDRAAGRALVSEDGGAPLVLLVQITGVGYHYEGAGADLRAGRDPTEATWRPPASLTVALEEDEQPKGAPVTCRLAG